jgi:hypothetical protein
MILFCSIMFLIRGFGGLVTLKKKLCQESLFVFDKSRGGGEEVIEEGK